MIRVIGSYNSKYENNDVAAECKVVEAWDGRTKVDIAYVLPAFYKHLQHKDAVRKKTYAMACKARNIKKIYNNNVNNKYTSILEQLNNNKEDRWQHADKLQYIALGDFRKRGVNMVLAPYFLNVKHMSADVAGQKILKWLNACSKVSPLGFDAYDLMRKALYYAAENNYLPYSIETIKEQDEQLYQKLTAATTTTISKEKIG
jgi:hypothetical protein